MNTAHLAKMTAVPDEIWHQIFSHHECVLPEGQWWMYGAQVDHSPRKTLASICRVSRQFLRVAQPFLYRTILLEGGDHEHKWRQEHLTRALAASPDLGLLTRTIAFDDSCLPRTIGLHSMLQGPLPSIDLPSTMRRYLETKLAESKQISNSSGKIGIGAFMLALMPRIRLVEFSFHGSTNLTWMMSGRADMDEQLIRDPDYECSDFEGDDMVTQTRKRTGGNTLTTDTRDTASTSFANYGLTHLKELRLRTGDSRHYTTSVHSIEAALLHPSLKTLRLLGSNWLQKSLDLLQWPKEPCGVQFLELRESLVEAASLRHILTRFTGLRTLLVHVASCRRYQDEEIEWDMNLDEIGSILRSLGGNLVELSLHTNNYEDYDEGPSQSEGHLGPLREMRSLKHLSVVCGDLIGNRAETQELPMLADVLPRLLETLHLHWDEKHYGEHSYRRRCGHVNNAVRKLLEHGHMPDLRQVSMERFYNETVEGEFDGPVAGWDMSVENRRLWMTYSTSGCGRTIVTFKKRD